MYRGGTEKYIRKPIAQTFCNSHMKFKRSSILANLVWRSVHDDPGMATVAPDDEDSSQDGHELPEYDDMEQEGAVEAIVATQLI